MTPGVVAEWFRQNQDEMEVQGLKGGSSPPIFLRTRGRKNPLHLLRHAQTQDTSQDLIVNPFFV